MLNARQNSETYKCLAQRHLRAATSFVAMLAAMPSLAFAAEATQQAQVEEIVVTGSRIATADPYSSATPLQTVSGDALALRTPRNLYEGLTQMPQLKSGGITSDNPQLTGLSQATNSIEMRRLGNGRTLVLLDGVRVGNGDVNSFPQNLVARVDIVTAGASATYGSDAVAGVVNFVLDKEFQGVKGEIGGGISTYGDGLSRKFNIAGGTPFLDGRGHVLASLAMSWTSGIGMGADGSTNPRSWATDGRCTLINDAGKTPQNVISTNCNNSTISKGGLITAGPLKGIAFGPSPQRGATGTPYQFQYGTMVGPVFMQGGEENRQGAPLTSTVENRTGFVHVDFDIAENFSAYASGGYAIQDNKWAAFWPAFGTGGAFTIFADNAYLPQSIKDQMAANNITSFQFGRLIMEAGKPSVHPHTEVLRAKIGFKGSIDSSALSNWTYDAVYSHEETNMSQHHRNNPALERSYAAADAVVNPATGTIVCRTTLYGLTPGCVPANLFGNGALTDKALQYMFIDARRIHNQDFDFVGINTQADLFELPAGPVGLALGGEYRKERFVVTGDNIGDSVVDFSGIRGAPAGLNGRIGGVQYSAPLGFAGQVSAREGYGELGVPIVKDVPFAKSFDTTLAVRFTGYSNNPGRVSTTWKVGATYEPNDDLLLRITRSRDTKAPTIENLFTRGGQAPTNYRLPNGSQVPGNSQSPGNPNLIPENGDTLTFGGVLRPTWLPGLNFSVDYWKIKITDAISSPGSGQQVVDQCYAGNQLYCSYLSFPGGTQQNPIYIVSRPPLANIAAITVAGLDFNINYKLPVGSGDLTLDAAATYDLKREECPPLVACIDVRNQLGASVGGGNGTSNTPKFTGTYSAQYDIDSWGFRVSGRFINSGKLFNNLVEGVHINDNSVPAYVYVDLGVNYSMDTELGQYQVYAAVNNVTNTGIPLETAHTGLFMQYQVNYNTYNPVGRYFAAGVRFNF